MEEKVLWAEQEVLSGLTRCGPVHSPPLWEDEDAEPPFLEFDLGTPLELGPDVKHFFRESANESREDEESDFPSEPLVEEYKRWLEWRGWAVNTPSLWWELGKIPEVGILQELAWKIWASFELPQWISEIHNVENYYLAPPSPKCLGWKGFLSPLDPMFPCQNTMEEQLKETVAYAQALQYWAEKSNPPTLGQPCLLGRCILELRETMEQYISFLDDTVLDGVAPVEGFFKAWAKITVPGEFLCTFTNAPIEEVTMKEAPPSWGPSRNLLYPKCHRKSGQRPELPQISSPVGGKCCTLLGQLLPLDKPLQS